MATKATGTFDESGTRAELLTLAGDLETLARRARELRLTIERTAEHGQAVRRLRDDMDDLERISSWASALKTDIEDLCAHAAASLRQEAGLGDGIARSA